MSGTSPPDALSSVRFVRRVAVVAIFAVAAALTVLYTHLLANTLLVLFAGLLLALFLRGSSRFLRSFLPVSRRAAVILTVLVTVLLLVALGWWIGPRATEQLAGLPGRLAEVVGDLRRSVEGTAGGEMLLERFRGELGQPAGVLGGVMGVFSTAVGAVANVFIIAFLGLFLAWDPEAYANPLLLLVPGEDGRQRARGVLHTVVAALESWLLARVLSMAVIGVLTVVSLLVAGVPLALALGLIAGALSFVPFIGPLMASVPAILVGLGESPETALAVAVIYTVIQAIESYVITPVIEHRMVSLPPALILTAQAVMGLLFGLVGLLVATPVALTLVVLVQTLYLEDQLDEEISPAGS